MRSFISSRLAENILLSAMGLDAVMHILTLTGLIPSGFVWGGSIQGSPEKLYLIEGLSLAITFVFIYVIAPKLVTSGQAKEIN